MRWSCLCLIHGNGCTERADTQTSNETADRELIPLLEGGDLDEDANDEDDTFDRHGISASKEVSNAE